MSGLVPGADTGVEDEYAIGDDSCGGVDSRGGVDSAAGVEYSAGIDSGAGAEVSGTACDVSGIGGASSDVTGQMVVETAVVIVTI